MTESTPTRWRVGHSYGVHVYTDEPLGKPVATFHRPEDAELAVEAVNRRGFLREALEARQRVRDLERDLTAAVEARQVAELENRRLRQMDAEVDRQRAATERTLAEEQRLRTRVAESRDRLARELEALTRARDALVDQAQVLLHLVADDDRGMPTTTPHRTKRHAVAALRQVIAQQDYVPGGRLSRAEKRAEDAEMQLAALRMAHGETPEVQA